MKRVLLIAFALLLGFVVNAQDPHFSQFNASPLTLNPAMAGKVQCTYRASVNYRDQWNSIPAPYVTYTAGFDMALMKEKLNGSAIGVGLLALNDRSGDGNLTAPNIGLFLAYHQRLGSNSILSVGFQGSFNEKRIDPTKLIFPNQITAGGVDPTLPNNEPFIGDIQYFDLNAGMHFSSIISDNFSLNIGTAVYHITQPKESFLNDPNNQVFLRYVAHGGFTTTLSDQWTISPSALYMRQANVDQLNAGASFGYHTDEASVYFGTWYRMHLLTSNQNNFNESLLSSVIALVGVEFNTLILGFSYDITANSLSQANGGRGGFELSLQYTGCIRKSRNITQCPTF